METPDTSIKRAPRTYGRRRGPDTSDVDVAYRAESSASSHSSPAFSESGGDVPPSSDFETSFAHADDDDDDAPDGSVVDIPTKFQFGWKKRMQELDTKFGDDDMEGAPPQRDLATDNEEEPAERRPHLTHHLSAGDDLSADDEDTTGPVAYLRLGIREELAKIDRNFDEDSGTGAHKVATLPLSDPDDPFGGFLAEPPGSSQPTATTRTNKVSSTSLLSPSPHIRRVKKRRPVALGSDSESEDAQHSSPQTSPSALHHINTPQRSSSPTPPTTQEMAQRKGKEKASGGAPANEELPALDTSKAQGKARGKRKEKEKRVKAPTRKERAETQKTTARIKADQQVTLQREEKRLRVTDLWEKFKPKLNVAQEPTDPPSEGSMSDPIQSFSSPMQAERPPPSFVHKPSGLRPPPPARHRSRTADPPLEMFAPTGLLGSGLSSSRPTASSSRQITPRTPSPSGDMFVSTGLLGDVSHGAAPAEDSSDDGGDLPDVGSLLEQDKRKRDAEQQRQRLVEMKMRFVNKQPIHLDDDSDLEIVDNDMHVVAAEEAKERFAAKTRHVRPSVGRKNQLSLAGRSIVYSPSKGTPVRRKREDIEVLQAAAVPAFSIEARAESKKGKERASAMVNSKDLNKLLLRASEKQSREIMRQKEREFYKRERGPKKTVDPAVLDAAVGQRIRELIEKGQLVARNQEQDEDGDDEAQDGESDEEWTPDVARDSEPEQATDDDEENKAPRVLEMTSGDENDAAEEADIARRPQRRSLMVVDSDDEDENTPSHASGDKGRVLVADSSLVLAPDASLSLHHRGSISSFDERFEDGTDKENDSRLMFDRGEDKENTVIASPSFPSVGLSRGSLFTQEGSRTPLPVASQDATGERTPFKELHKEDDDDVFLSSPTRPPLPRVTSARQGTPGTPRPQPVDLGNSSPVRLRSPAPKESPGLAAFFKPSFPSDKGKGRAGVSGGLQPAAVIGSGSGGFSQFFNPTLKTSAVAPTARGEGFSQFFTPSKNVVGIGAVSKPDASLSLSLESNLQPSLHVDEELVKKADEIFDREQEAIVAHAVAEDSEKRNAAMYVNEHGFLTQNQPSAALPAWALGSPTSPLFASSPAYQALLKSAAKSALKPREPLGTLALAVEDDQDSDDGQPRRLRKRGSTPHLADKAKYRSSASPTPPKRRNAFDVLGQRQDKLKAPKFMKKLKKSAFIEGEAEESDEDAGFGFGLVKKKDDEEESDEEQDKMLEGLVDDAAMDADTLGEEKVWEKVKEHQAIDDALDEKVARDAAEGKLRIKRRNRLLDFEDEDSDDEDEDARRRRQRMAKKRRIDGDTLEQLARNPETEAFVKAYHVDNEDDNEEFAHLGQDEMDLAFIDRNADDEEGDEDDDENEPPEIVSAVELQEQLRRVARGEETVKTIDTNDVDWVFKDEDDDMDDENIRIKEVATTSNKTLLRGAKPNQMEWEVMQQPRREDSVQDMARQQKWARSEGGSRNPGTGRASAVTGHKSAKAGGGSIIGRRSEQGQAQKKAAKLAKAPSALSAVSDRRARFA